MKLTSCDNQALVGCIPIATVAVHLNLKSYKLVCEFSRVYDNFKCLYEKSLETYRMHLVSSLGFKDFNYQHCIFFYAKFHPYIITQYPSYIIIIIIIIIIVT